MVLLLRCQEKVFFFSFFIFMIIELWYTQSVRDVRLLAKLSMHRDDERVSIYALTFEVMILWNCFVQKIWRSYVELRCLRFRNKVYVTRLSVLPDKLAKYDEIFIFSFRKNLTNGINLLYSSYYLISYRITIV